MGWEGVSHKATNEEMRQRVEEALGMMLDDNVKYVDYLSYAQDKYGIARTPANNVWVRARDLRNQLLMERLDDEIANAVLELEQFEQEMISSDNQQADALRLRAKDMKYKIKGLYQERIKLEGNITTTIQFEWGGDDNVIDIEADEV